LSGALGVDFPRSAYMLPHLHPQGEHRHPAGHVDHHRDEVPQHLQHHHPVLEVPRVRGQPVLDNKVLQDHEDDKFYSAGGGDPNKGREDQLVLDVEDAMDEEAEI